MNVDEILKEKIYSNGYEKIKVLFPSLERLQKEAIKEIVKQTIQMCADNAKTQKSDNFFQSYNEIDRESILKTIEQIKL